MINPPEALKVGMNMINPPLTGCSRNTAAQIQWTTKSSRSANAFERGPVFMRVHSRAQLDWNASRDRTEPETPRESDVVEPQGTSKARACLQPELLVRLPLRGQQDPREQVVHGDREFKRRIKPAQTDSSKLAN